MFADLALAHAVAAIARAAGDVILPFFRQNAAVTRKADDSPVTEADRAADRAIAAALAALTPDIPVVSEERIGEARSPASLGEGRFWLVDPLDGTKEFVANRDEFTVNIGLIEKRRPILGVVALPARGIVYGAAGPGTAFVRRGAAAPVAIAARTAPASGIVVAHSRSHANWSKLDTYLAGFTVAERIVEGSAGKFGLIAEGRADLYPRFGPTMEWDTAAGQAVLEAAGGSVRDHAGATLAYGKPDFRNPPFVARGRD